MAAFLRQSTAVDIALGPFVDATDGVTAETGLTIAQADVRLKKNNGNWAQKNNASSATHEEFGWYEAPLSATDTDTLGILMVAVSVSGALPLWREFLVIPAVVYDALVSGTDNLDVNTVQWLGTACATPTVAGVPEVDLTHVQGSAAPALVSGRLDASVGAMAANVLTATAINADAITAAKVAADVSLEIADAVWDEARAGHVGAGSFGEGVLVASGGITSTSFAANAITNSAIAADAIGSSELAASAATEIAGAVWDELRASHTTAGSFGQGVASVQGPVGSVAGDVTGNVDGTVGGVLTDGIDAAALASDAVTEIAAGVWNALRASYATAGTFGEGAASVQGNVTGNVSGSVGSVSGAVGSVTGNVGGNVNGSVGSVGSGGITASSFAANALSAAALASAAANKIADHVLRRTYANARTSSDGDAVNFRSLLGAVGKLVNKWSISGSTLTIYQEDDATSTAPGGTQALTTNAAADPITGVDTT